MSERSPGDLNEPGLPPGWTASDATTPGGFIYVAVWREFRDLTQLELDCAQSAPLGSPPGLPGLHAARAPSLAGIALATVRALRAARGERPDLSDDQWERLIRRIWPTVGSAQRMEAREILAEIDLTHPMPPRRTLPAEVLAASAPARRRDGPKPIVDRDEVEICQAALRAAGKPHGYQAVARALAVSVSTVRRRLAGH